MLYTSWIQHRNCYKYKRRPDYKMTQTLMRNFRKQYILIIIILFGMTFMFSNWIVFSTTIYTSFRLDALDPNAYAAFQASRDLRDVVERVVENRGDKPGVSKKLSVRASLMTPVLPMLVCSPCNVKNTLKLFYSVMCPVICFKIVL